MMHVYAVPAKNMSAVGHLGSFEVILEADSAFELVSGVVDHLLNSFPFVLADAFEAVE